jgi:hypothetical protein
MAQWLWVVPYIWQRETVLHASCLAFEVMGQLDDVRIDYCCVCVKVRYCCVRSRHRVLFLRQSSHQVMCGRSTKLHTLLKFRMKHSMMTEGDMTLFSVSSFIVMQWLYNGNCDGCKTCLTFETPSSAHVYICFKMYSSTVQSMDHSLTHPTEKFL